METERVDEQEEQLAVASESMLGAITSAEIDRQIATAKRYPRSLAKFKKEVQEMSCLDEETASECMYALPRKEKNGQTKNIEGPSARFAEIVVSAWGNARAGARVIAEEKDFIVAQGMFHDLERNVAIQFEVKRRISDRFGRRFSSDMIAVTGNAAASIALRNAIFKGVPKAYWAPAFEQARITALGKAQTLATRRSEALKHFSKYGVTEEQMLAAVGRKGIEDVTLDDLATWKGIATAIKDGDATIESVFPEPTKANATSTPPKQADAPPPQSKVEESTGYGDADPAEPEAPKKGKKGKKEPAPAARGTDDLDDNANPRIPLDDERVEKVIEEVVRGDVDAEAKQHAEDEKAQAEAEAASPAAGTLSIPLGDETVIVLPFHGGLDFSPTKAGALAWTGGNKAPFHQWDGKKWVRFADDEVAYDWAHKHMQKKITQHCKRARMERSQALLWAAETLSMAKPIEQFAQLTLTQLVELARTLDSPKE